LPERRKEEEKKKRKGEKHDFHIHYSMRPGENTARDKVLRARACTAGRAMPGWTPPWAKFPPGSEEQLTWLELQLIFQKTTDIK